MTVFDDSMEHGFAALLSQHGETVSYKFRNTGDVVSRTAMVDRNPPDVVDQLGNVIGFSLMVSFHNDSTDGVLSNVVDNGGDEISVALKTNGTEEWRPVFSLLEGDGGVTRVAVR